jgi:uncharacterized protein (TIGR02246 family)
MKTTTLKALMLCIAFAFTASAVSAQHADEIKIKIEKINKEMQQAMLSGNTTASLAYYTSDAVSLPNYGKIAEGFDAIKKSSEEMAASGMKIASFETNILTVNTCEKNILEVGTYKMSFTMQGAPGTMTDEGKYVTIWEQQADGSLKIKLEMWNTDVYPMAGN